MGKQSVVSFGGPRAEDVGVSPGRNFDNRGTEKIGLGVFQWFKAHIWLPEIVSSDKWFWRFYGGCSKHPAGVQISKLGRMHFQMGLRFTGIDGRNVYQNVIVSFKGLSCSLLSGN